MVGRQPEQETFRALLDEGQPATQALYVYGPGGVGKTTLLKEFRSLCRARDVDHTRIDGRDTDATPDAFLGVLAAWLGLDSTSTVQEALATRTSKAVIIVDTYEKLAPLDNWLRENLLPELSAQVIVVLAGRTPPGVAWKSDPAWRRGIQPLALRNLAPADCREFFDRHTIPEGQREAVLRFTHGHPLALALVADAFAQRPELQFQPEATPDVIQALLDQFISKVPGPAHRRALEACALLRSTTESLLAAMLAMPEVSELFDWLRNLSFVDMGPQGIYPHDLAREALVADLRWRNPDWYAELHNRARGYYQQRLQQGGSQEQHILFDYIFLHRDNPVVRASFDWQSSGSAYSDIMRPDDLPALRAMVSEHEGEESAAVAAMWLDMFPEHCVVFREGGGVPAGFLLLLPLEQIDRARRQDDPGVEAALSFLDRNAPLREGERATLFRFWMARDGYQQVSPVQSLIVVNVVMHYLMTPGLAYTLMPCAQPDFWMLAFSYADLARLKEADFELGGKAYGVYGHDWRVRPPMAWLDLLAERELAMSPQVKPAARSGGLVVLSQPDFVESVREALRKYLQPAVLRENPLLQSRLLLDKSGGDSTPADAIAALQQLLAETAEALKSTPRKEKLYRALHMTYFNPVGNQEDAAEALNLPFSTYRRHLRQAIDELTDLLWRQEIGT